MSVGYWGPCGPPRSTAKNQVFYCEAIKKNGRSSYLKVAAAAVLLLFFDIGLRLITVLLWCAPGKTPEHLAEIALRIVL